MVGWWRTVNFARACSDGSGFGRWGFFPRRGYFRRHKRHRPSQEQRCFDHGCTAIADGKDESKDEGRKNDPPAPTSDLDFRRFRRAALDAATLTPAPDAPLPLPYSRGSDAPALRRSISAPTPPATVTKCPSRSGLGVDSQIGHMEKLMRRRSAPLPPGTASGSRFCVSH